MCLCVSFFYRILFPSVPHQSYSTPLLPSRLFKKAGHRGKQPPMATCPWGRTHGRSSGRYYARRRHISIWIPETCWRCSRFNYELWPLRGINTNGTKDQISSAKIVFIYLPFLMEFTLSVYLHFHRKHPTSSILRLWSNNKYCLAIVFISQSIALYTVLWCWVWCCNTMHNLFFIQLLKV